MFYSSSWTFEPARREGKHLRPGSCNEENADIENVEFPSLTQMVSLCVVGNRYVRT